MTRSSWSLLRGRRSGVALAILIALGCAEGAAFAAGAGKGGCAALERQLGVRLRRQLESCGSALTRATRSCAGAKRRRHVSELVAHGCPRPPWAVAIANVKVNPDTVALVWKSRLNWARLLDRPSDPIASTVRLPDDSFDNVLLLDPSSDLAGVVDYVIDLEGRATDIDDGLPGSLGGKRGRGSFPIVRDRSSFEAALAFLDLAFACQEETPSLFADRAFGGVSERMSREPSNDPGATATELAYIVREIIRFLGEDDGPPPEPPAEDPPAESPDPDDGQCTENSEGKCDEGGENPDDEQSEEGSDDAEGTPAPAPSPAPSGGQNPTSDPGSPDGGSCEKSLDSIVTACESFDWQTPACRAIVQMMNGCADESLINPGPEGEVPCTGDGMSEEEYRELECERRGGIAQPGPDGELVCRTVDTGVLLPDFGGAFDPCNDPEAQGTDEMCADQHSGGPGVGEVPPSPIPDPRARAR